MSKKKRGKQQNEWFLDFPWGKVAMVSWGDSSHRPVLLMHGYMDNAGTFATLIEQLPDNYYYVACDIPGHGKSDAFPLGPLLNTGHMVEVLRSVVHRMKWRKFFFVGHSMGFIIGALYNHVYPNQMSRIIGIDPQPPISNLFFSDHTHVLYMSRYPDYYDGLNSSTQDQKKYYTRKQTLAHVMKTRKLTAEQARPLVERALVPVGNGVYRLSFERNAKMITNIPLSFSSFLHILTSRPIPTLMLHSSESIMFPITVKKTNEFMENLREKLPQLEEKTILGGHDIHLTNSNECAETIREFLEKDFRIKKSKL